MDTKHQKQKVFISYRRDDSSWALDYLLTELQKYFGEIFFRDIDGITPGEDFREVISSALKSSEIMLVIIGENWLHAKDEQGNERLKQSGDWVKFEINQALINNIKIIPITLAPAELPKVNELPVDISQLSYKQAINIFPGQDFRHGFEKLASQITQELNIEKLEPDVQVNKITWTSKVAGIIFSCLILLLCLALYLTNSYNSSNDNQLALQKVADTYKKELDKWFDSKINQIESAATSQNFRNNDKEELYTSLTTLCAGNTFPGGCYALDENGKVITHYTPNFPSMNIIGQDYSHRPYFKNSRDTGKIVLSNTFVSGNRQKKIIVIAAPRRNLSGMFIGIVDGVIDIAKSELSDTAIRISQSQANGQVDIYLLDDNGVVMASSLNEKVTNTFFDTKLFYDYKHNLISSESSLNTAYRKIINTPYHILAVGKHN